MSITYKNLKIVFLISLLTFSAGCTNLSTFFHPNKQANPSLQTQARSKHAENKLLALTSKLRQQGVEVVKVGETISIIVPSDLLFNTGSANLIFNAHYILDTVADYLKLYSKTFVEIAGYTDYLEDPQFTNKNQLLTTQQAAQVSKYLWSRDMDSRMFYSRGYGADYPVRKSNAALGGNTENRRIEINFQFNVDKANS